MAASVKFIIGLAGVMLMGWLHHGPLGHGARFVDGLEAGARTAVAAAEVPGVNVRLGHDPLSRRATLSGPANDFQREGMGEFPGIDDRVAVIEGISGTQWADEGELGAGVPLLVESLALILVAYLAGVGIAWLLFGRPRRDGYL